jgi:predicted protein tyrosine phosphatase
MMTDKVMNYPIMKGNARMALGASYFEVPLFSQITDKLWTGCSPSEFPDELEAFGYEPLMRYSPGISKCHWLHDTEFQAIVNLYPWGQYVRPDNVLEEDYLEVEMSDSADTDDLLVRVAALSAWIVMTVDEEGKKTLVHCQAGLNRSALVAAAYLIRTGMSVDEAIQLLRDKRSPVVLCNSYFEKWLRKNESEFREGSL